MSYDAVITMNRFTATRRVGDSLQNIIDAEARRIIVTLTPASGTLTVQATPQVCLVDASNAFVNSIINSNVTGYDSGAQDAPRVWYKLDTASIAAGTYTLIFVINVVDSGGNASTLVRKVKVIVE